MLELEHEFFNKFLYVFCSMLEFILSIARHEP